LTLYRLFVIVLAATNQAIRSEKAGHGAFIHRVMRQLTINEINEIKMLFEYYLALIPSHKPVMDFVETQGFEDLQCLLAALEAKK
jgi:hypothetical protein